MPDLKVLMLPPDEVFPDPHQPRQTFDREELERMTASIKARGVMQPIRVRWDEQRGCWVIISGECRWRCSKAAGLAAIPCLPVEGEPEEVDLLADQIIENVVRNSLRPLELARSMARLKALKGCNSQTLARELGISGATVTRAESLLSLPDDIQTLVDRGDVAESIGYTISRLPDAASQREMAEAVAAGKLGRSQVTDAVQGILGKKNMRPKASRLSCRLDGGLSVTVSAGGPVTAKSLGLVIEYLKSEARKLEKTGSSPVATLQAS